MSSNLEKIDDQIELAQEKSTPEVRSSHALIAIAMALREIAKNTEKRDFVGGPR